MREYKIHKEDNKIQRISFVDIITEENHQVTTLNFTEKEIETISKNLMAFVENFGEHISFNKDKYNHYFYVHNETNTIYNCDNINHLNGYLYGAVQANNKRFMKRCEE